MKLILREDVHNLGKSGALVTVKDGFGRNFLLPRKMAVLANEQNVKQLEHEQAVIAARQAKLKAGADEEAKKLGGVQVKIARKVGEQDKLFGSVTARDISEALKEKGVHVDSKKIHLEEPIKVLGLAEVPVKLGRGVSATIKVWVVKKED